MSTLATASAEIYECLLLAYPQQFRRKYGEEMASIFSENCRYTCQSHGSYAVIGLWLSTLQDLMISASSEHVSSFICKAKSDVRAIARAPVFVAASGALVAALFFISIAFVRISFFHDASLRQFNSIVAAAVNIASLWLTSTVALRLLRGVFGGKRYDQMPFVSRLRAFNHLASISFVLALVAILKYAVSAERLEGFSSQSLSSPQHWIVFPVVVVCTVSSVILLDPLLTLRSSASKDSNRKSAVSTRVLDLSFANHSDESNR
jgi:hypothetical protein